MQQHSELIHDQLLGVWVPVRNRVPPDRPWPRLVFLTDQAFYEDGDHPVIYSVEHFRYELTGPAVLTILESHQEHLSDTTDGTVVDDSWIHCRHYDIEFHRFGNDLYLDIELHPGPPTLTQYFKTAEAVDADYRPNWRLH